MKFRHSAVAIVCAWAWLSHGVGSATRGQTIVVRAGEDLQRALDAAQSGDTLLLEPGATFRGNFVLPARRGTEYITVRSATPDAELPGTGQRILPSDAPRLARLESPNSLPVLTTARGAHHWRLAFLEFGPNATPNGDIIRLGDPAQTSLDLVPHDLIIDHCYIHGDPAVGQKRGIALNSAATRIVDSYFSDFKLVGQDAQAVAGWNGPGPYLIENNYLEGAGENVLFGGADSAIPGLVPANIVFRRNHVAKPVNWRRERWQVKNLFELKNARRVVIEQNLFEHNWHAAQTGPAILFTPRNQDGRAPWSTVEQVIFRGNIVRHVAAVFNVLGTDYNYPSGRVSRLDIRHNLFAGIDAAQWGGTGTFLQIGDGPEHVWIQNNTILQSGSVVSVYGTPTRGFVFRNNLVHHNTYGIKGDSRQTGHDTIREYFPGAVVTHNVFAGGPAARYPTGNHFPPMAIWVLQFRDYHRGDYTLADSSSYRNAGADGSDLGVRPEMIATAATTPLGGR